MLRLQKQTISRYLASGCKRQLFLNLRLEHDLKGTNYPARIVRPALQNVRELGEEWEALKVGELLQTFGDSRLLGKRKLTQLSFPGMAGPSTPSPAGQPSSIFGDTHLFNELQQAAEDTIIVQGEYEVPQGFLQRQNLLRYTVPPTSLQFSNLRPDLIWVRSCGTYQRYVTADGGVQGLPAEDARLQLQVIDIKLTAEPSHRHYSEITYYILALASWLVEQGWDQQFVVVPDGSVWPGSYEAGALKRLAWQMNSAAPSIDELSRALSEELETVPFEPMAQRLATFFSRDLVEVLETPDWRTLPWHITQKSCSMCDFLGIDESISTPSHPNYCHVEATLSDSLTRIPFLGRGSKAELEIQQVQTTSQLRLLSPHDPIFADHNQLRAERTLLNKRAEALYQQRTLIPGGRQTIALPAPWDCDLKIFLTLDFDPGSGLTYAFGFRSLWWPPRSDASNSLNSPVETPPSRPQPKKKEVVFLVQRRDPQAELQQLLLVLETIMVTVAEVEQAFASGGSNGKEIVPKVQFYLWDTIQAEHIRRVMGRHMYDPNIQDRFQHLIWRFPPDNILRNAELEKNAPIAIVKTAVRQLIALPLPYDYPLLQTARVYHPLAVNPKWFDVPDLFESGLGDQIPYERAHEIWSGKGYRSAKRGTSIPWNTLVSWMERTVKAKLSALDAVVSKLEEDLARQRRLLLKPKAMRVGQRPRKPRGMSVDGQLLLHYALLESVSRKLEIDAIRAMELDEREARYHTAVLTKRLEGDAAQQALEMMDLQAVPGLWVFEMRPTSVEVKLEAEDFLCALAPADVPGFLDWRVFDLAGKDKQLAEQLTGDSSSIWSRLENFTKVTIREIDRDNLWLAVALDNPQFIEAAEQLNLIDFSQNVVLDKLYRDYWTDRLERCLKAIGNPSIAKPAPQSRGALLQ